MRVAVPVTNGFVDGPGEGEEVYVYDLSPEPKLVEKYPNPAITAVSARGIWMLRSALDRNVEKLIVSGVGQHAFTVVDGKLKFYHADGMKVEDAVATFIEDKLPELTEPNHVHGHHH